MSRKLAPWLTALAAVAVTAVTAAPASAAGVIDPAPIGHNQYFTGLVNGQAGQATIRMACFGPIRPGQTGHPMAGQTVEVLPALDPVTKDIGYTGSAARAVDVRFPTPASTSAPVRLHAYAVAAPIPVSLTLPCGGTGKVAFVPVPTGPTARTATVTVSFVGQP